MERRPHLFWPLALIASGILWILIELGRIPASNLWALTYVWPLLLVGAGVSLILRPYWRFAGPAVSALIIAVLFLSVLFAGQLGWNRVPAFGSDGGLFYWGATTRGSGHFVTEQRDVKGFTSVKLGYPANVLVRQGSTDSLTIEAEDNIAPTIRSEVVNGTLEIGVPRGHRLNIIPTHVVKITVTARQLKDVTFDAAGDLTVQSLNGDSFRVTLNGAGNVNLEDVKLQSVDAVLNGAGTLRASGTTDGLSLDLNGLGSFDGAALHAQTAAIELNGMGSADVWVEKQITAKITGVGSVNYYGSPQVSKTVTGLGGLNYKGEK